MAYKHDQEAIKETKGKHHAEATPTVEEMTSPNTPEEIPIDASKNDDDLFRTLFPPGDRLGKATSTESGQKWTVPASAGGSDSPAEVIVDGMCQYNGLTGIDALPEKKRTSWVRAVSEIVTEWGGASVSEAKLTWRAFMLRFGWRKTINPFYRSISSDFGPLLLAVKDGSITEYTLIQEEQGTTEPKAYAAIREYCQRHDIPIGQEVPHGDT